MSSMTCYFHKAVIPLACIHKREMSVDDNLCTLPHSHTGSVSIPSPAPPPPLTRRDLATILDEIEPVEDWRSLGLELMCQHTS